MAGILGEDWQAPTPYHSQGMCAERPHVLHSVAQPGSPHALIAELKRSDIHPVFHYVPLHSAPIGVRLGHTHGELAVTDSIADRLLRLPLWLGLEEQQAGVIQQIISVSD